MFALIISDYTSCYKQTFEDGVYRRHAEEAGLSPISTCIYKSDIKLDGFSFYQGPKFTAPFGHQILPTSHK